MNIWYVNHYSPGTRNPKEGRAYFLSKGLVENGAECAVIGASFHHLIRESSQQREQICSRNVDGIPFVWLKTPTYVGNGFGRLKNMFIFALRFFNIDLVAKSILNKPDAIIISSGHPFHFLAGLKWARKFDAKLVFEVRDLWPLSLNLIVGLSRFHPLTIVLALFERLAYIKSDLIVSLLPNAFEHMAAYGVKRDRFINIPNGYSVSVPASNQCNIDESLRRIRKKYSLLIMHTGSMGQPNGLQLLLEVANDFRANSKVGFVFIGGGSCKDELMQASNSPHVFFFDAIPKDQVQQALSYADIGYCGSQKGLGDLYKYGVSPNKIFDYMAAGKFILFVVDSFNTPVDLAGCGVRYSPSDLEGIKMFICSAVQNENFLHNAGSRGKVYLQKNHEYTLLTKKLLNKLGELELN